MAGQKMSEPEERGKRYHEFDDRKYNELFQPFNKYGLKLIRSDIGYSSLKGYLEDPHRTIRLALAVNKKEALSMVPKVLDAMDKFWVATHKPEYGQLVFIAELKGFGYDGTSGILTIDVGLGSRRYIVLPKRVKFE